MDENQEVETTEETEVQETKPSPIEQEARQMGHVSKEEWEASGKDPEEWVSAKEYVRYGKLQRSMHAKLDAQKRQYDTQLSERIDNLNKYHEAQRQIELDNLRLQQREAVESADTEKFDRLQTQIEKVEKQTPAEPTTTDSAKDPAITAWEQQNPWVYDPNDNRTILANAKLSQFLTQNPNGTMEEGLRFVDNEISKAFPKQNMKRETAQQTTETSQRQGTREPKKISMNDLSFEEKQFWNQAGQSMFGGDQEKFLQAVTDARKGGQHAGA